MGRLIAVCALFSLGLLLLGACQGEYPLEPTVCDRWCEATKELQCGYYDPAGCVLGCEEQALVQRECPDQFNAALVCYEQSSIPCEEDNPYWYFSGPFPCETEQIQLSRCMEQFGLYGFPL